LYKETNLRSIAKGITWRVVATGTTMTIVYIFFGNLELAVATGLLETVAKIALYWGHEKVKILLFICLSNNLNCDKITL
jgi:adenylylsulfate kinase